MKLRLLFTSVILSLVTVVPTWVTLQPMMIRGMGSGRWQQLSTFLLSFDLVVATLVVYVVLHFTLGRPIERISTTVKSLAADDEHEVGGLLLRVDRALRRLALDLSEERRLNTKRLDELTSSHDAMVRLQAELVATDRLATVGKLASGVAHEVGNPLAGILGYLSVVRLRAKEHPELIDLVGRIEHEVQRIDQIVRSLLDLGRPSRGKAEAIDVRPVIGSCVQLLGASRDFEGVRVDVEGPSSLWVLAESGPLSQVLVNLLINAAQAMAGQGRIVVRAASATEGATVIVDDEGPGLPQEAKERLFEPFFTTKEAGKGTGLGLAVSRHLLAQFEGRLEAGDNPEGGARFTIALKTP
jgi:two-component system, NtrC family, sensor kinase